MSMTTELIDRLRKDSKNPFLGGGIGERLEEAANVIEELSAKLHAAQMERSSQYYHGGWIPVEERMPEERTSVFAKFKDTSKWKNSMFERISENVLVTVEFDDGKRKTEVSHTTDGKWMFGISSLNRKVLAWRPLPNPYSSGKEDAE